MLLAQKIVRLRAVVIRQNINPVLEVKLSGQRGRTATRSGKTSSRWKNYVVCRQYRTPSVVIMAALCNRADRYFCPVVYIFFLLISSPNLTGRILDVYHTLAPGVALVRI